MCHLLSPGSDHLKGVVAVVVACFVGLFVCFLIVISFSQNLLPGFNPYIPNSRLTTLKVSFLDDGWI